MPSPNPKQKKHPLGLRTVMELFDIGPGVAISVLSITALALAGALIWFLHSSPPAEITISGGPLGSSFHRQATRYAVFLQKHGIRVKVLESNGSVENLKRLADPKAHVDVALAQSGVNFQGGENLVSLGSVSHQPLLLFYRGKPTEYLRDLAGKRIAIGPEGSGTRDFALAVLKATKIAEEGKTDFLDLDANAAAQALQEGKIDAAFVMSENLSVKLLISLIHDSKVRLFHFRQAAAYSRKIEALDVLEVPEGAIDLFQDIPAKDTTLLGPMVELVAQKDLHPVVVDLLIDAATKVNGKAELFQKRGEFPAPIEHSIPLSDEAVNYYKSGKSFLFRMLPFRLASFLSRFVMVFLPVFLILIPVLKSIPAFFRWVTRARINGRYRELLTLEREIFAEKDRVRRAELVREFDRITELVNRMKVRASFADQIYGLRGHIDYVRKLVETQSL